MMKNTFFARIMSDERGFVHKRLLGLAKTVVGAVTSPVGRTISSVVPGGGLIGTLGRIGGGFFGGRPPPPSPGGLPVTTRFAPQPPPPIPLRQRANVPLPTALQITIPEAFEFAKDLLKIPGGGGSPIPGGGLLGLNGGGLPCEPPLVPSGFPDVPCVFPGSPAFGAEARMGQFGAALEPTFFTINQRRCLPGMILGKDKLCYNMGAISNKERLWPKGAAPLLTGGEMSAIRKAATAAGKFQRAGKRLAAVGKTFNGPAGRRAPPRRLTAGKTVKVLESGPGSVQL